MNTIKQFYNNFVNWLAGGYPLCFTYWITGVILNGMISLCLYAINYQIGHGTIELNTGEVIFFIIIFLKVVLVPLTLWAISMSIGNYEGFWVWRVLAILAVISGVFNYFSFCAEIIKAFVAV
ncbi:hypothetical protein [Citrobacter enshiensis]|uniref:hypothetical protein n=1 Tax=Citrobacter enshiensis TaxID=2971264 RepID=UPI0023E83614|nr:hypothetical protein [Citrobacter enshiensis]WET38995.1 hypothetical protein P2W74_13415 [Citrobacter enshiensis]